MIVMEQNSSLRYIKNTNAFSVRDMALIHEKKICVVGCGGLGGHVALTLARFGVQHLTLVDSDVFSISNLNRQCFSNEQNIGKNKATEAQTQISLINSDVNVSVVQEMLTDCNAAEIIAGHDLVMDCLDNITARRTVDRACETLGIPYVHGAIAGFYGQVATVFPGDGHLRRIYPEEREFKGLENELGNPPFTPQLVAAIQCSEALKLLCGRGELLRNKMLYIDLYYNNFEEIYFSD